jgi:hypothetical protein
MLKAIEVEFKTKKYLINQWIVLICRYIAEDISILMQKGMDNLYKNKKKSNFELMFYLMKTIIASLNGGFNILRKTTIQHCRSLVNEEVLSKSDRN